MASRSNSASPWSKSWSTLDGECRRCRRAGGDLASKPVLNIPPAFSNQFNLDSSARNSQLTTNNSQLTPPVLPTQAAVQPKKVLRVSEVTRYLKQLMERDSLLSLLQVYGEATNLSKSGSGWIYFSLKDNLSQLPCVISSKQAVSLRQELAALENGVTVQVEGSISVYEPRGTYQLSVLRMRVGGSGAAKIRFERLREKLEAEGLFAADRKRPLPRYPSKLVLVTAPNSEAYHDVVTRLGMLWPWVTVIVAPVSVQGEHAAGQIATAIDIANRSTDADAIVLAGGGGAVEELDAFNDERLARVIFASRIPVITGIGHTQNVTIADLVADVRAPTPTAAAVAAVPDGPALAKSCRQLYYAARSHMARGLSARRNRLARAESELLRCSPERRIATRRQRLDEVWGGLERVVSRDLQLRRRRLDALQRQMDALNPEGILSRGYALLTDAGSGAVISSAQQATPGRRIRAQVKDGDFQVTVQG